MCDWEINGIEQAKGRKVLGWEGGEEVTCLHLQPLSAVLKVKHDDCANVWQEAEGIQMGIWREERWLWDHLLREHRWRHATSSLHASVAWTSLPKCPAPFPLGFWQNLTHFSHWLREHHFQEAFSGENLFPLDCCFNLLYNYNVFNHISMSLRRDYGSWEDSIHIHWPELEVEGQGQACEEHPTG